MACVVATVCALQSYHAEEATELTFKEGDTISVLSKEEANWWYGVAEDGREGYFPVDYVTEVKRFAMIFSWLETK